MRQFALRKTWVPAAATFVLCLGLGAVALTLGKTWILRGLGGLLVEDTSPLSAAHAVVLLVGDVGERTLKAAELHRQGLAKYVVMVPNQTTPATPYESCPPDTEWMTRMLQENGVPSSAIILAPLTASSTKEEATAVRDLFIRRGWVGKKITLVTSWYHTARASWIFRRVLGESGSELQTVSANFRSTREESWWMDEESFFLVFSEYVKWVWYLWNYSAVSV